MSMVFRLAVFFILTAFVINTNYSFLYAEETSKSVVAEIVYSPLELVQMEKWKDKSMDELSKDAFNGDPAGLFMIGMCFMTGSQGFVIDVEKANDLFSLSASLGFAPALDQIKAMYIEEKQDPLLAMVYLNLAASFGHTELVIPYHMIRAKIIDAFGMNVVKEIEKIVSKKKAQIDKNLENIRVNKTDCLSYLLTGDITSYDCIYNNDYWLKVIRGELSK